MLHARIEDVRDGVLLRVVRNLTLPVLKRKFFINEFVKGCFPLEHKTVLKYFNPVPIVGAEVKIINGKDQETRKPVNFKEVTIVEDKNKAPQLMPSERKKKTPLNLDTALLARKEAREPVEVDVLPN